MATNVTHRTLDKALRGYDMFLLGFEKAVVGGKAVYTVDAVYFESGIPRALILAAEAGPEEADDYADAWDKLDDGSSVRVVRKGNKVTYRGDYRGTEPQSSSAMADIIAGLNAAISGDYVL